MAKVKIEIEDSNVITLERMAKEFGEYWDVEAKANYESDCVDFMTDDGIPAYVDASGFANRRDNDVPLDEYNTDWAEDIFDVPDVVWAHDENGNLVALTN